MRRALSLARGPQGAMPPKAQCRTCGIARSHGLAAAYFFGNENWEVLYPRIEGLPRTRPEGTPA